MEAKTCKQNPIVSSFDKLVASTDEKRITEYESFLDMLRLSGELNNSGGVSSKIERLEVLSYELSNNDVAEPREGFSSWLTNVIMFLYQERINPTVRRESVENGIEYPKSTDYLLAPRKGWVYAGDGWRGGSEEPSGSEPEQPEPHPTIEELEKAVKYPYIPENVPLPEEGWVYVGGAWRECNVAPSDDIALFDGSGWDYTGWRGYDIDIDEHYAVRIGSDIHREWLLWKANLK